jgi:arylsulfatase A-like enzyme
MPSAIGMRSNATMPRPPQKWCAESLGPLMKRAGYRCAYGGKPHLVPGLAEYVMKNGYENLTGDSRDKLAKECVEFIRRPDDRPFFLFASFINPHDICFMAINDLARHEGKPIAKSFDAQFCDSMLNKALASGDLEAFVSKNCPPLPPNFEPAAGEPECVRVDHLRDQPWTAYARQEWSEQRWRLHRWLYCRLTESVDAQIEVVLRSLKEAGLEEKTLVIFSSDHGEMDGAHRLEQKATLYEEAARIPFIVTWKGTLPGGKVDREHLVSNGLDLLPTVCDFAGVAPPADLPGRSVRPLIEGRAGTGWRDHLVVETKDGRMIRDDRFKYCIYEHGENRETLVDLKIDPGEMKNLIGSAEHADEVKRLQKLLFEWATRWDDRPGLAYIKH